MSYSLSPASLGQDSVLFAPAAPKPSAVTSGGPLKTLAEGRGGRAAAGLVRHGRDVLSCWLGVQSSKPETQVRLARVMSQRCCENAAHRTPRNGRKVFSQFWGHELEIQGGRGHAPSRASRGRSFLPLQPLGLQASWAYGHVPPISVSVLTRLLPCTHVSLVRIPVVRCRAHLDKPA